MIPPVNRSYGPPSRPPAPNAEIRVTPATTGGSTSGTTTAARSSPRPRNGTRASSHASGVPATTQADHRGQGRDQRDPQGVAHLRGAEQSGQVGPGGVDGQRDERYQQEHRRHQRRQHQQQRRAAEDGAGHAPITGRVTGAGPKPASASSRCPSAESTRSTNSRARSASSDCSQQGDWIDLRLGVGLGDVDLPDVVAGGHGVGDVDEAGVDLAGGDLLERRLTSTSSVAGSLPISSAVEQRRGGRAARRGVDAHGVGDAVLVEVLDALDARRVLGRHHQGDHVGGERRRRRRPRRRRRRRPACVRSSAVASTSPGAPRPPAGRERGGGVERERHLDAVVLLLELLGQRLEGAR